jgi:hypothetical protein
MEYNRIIAITGLGGLYEMLSSKTDGAIVRSLEDQQTRFVSSRIHNFSHLESIEVYTVRENINLVDLFKAIQDSGEALPSEKDAAAVKAFFEKVYPEMDFSRIYNSDMKKMVRWYSLLSSNQIEFKLTEPEEGEELEETVAVEESPVTGSAKKAAKPAADKKAPAEAHAEEAPAEEAPAKKKAVKKAAESEEASADPAPKKAAKPATKKAAEPAEGEAEEAPAKKKAAPKKK